MTQSVAVAVAVHPTIGCSKFTSALRHFNDVGRAEDDASAILPGESGERDAVVAALQWNPSQASI
jgi:hypothetical protein